MEKITLEQLIKFLLKEENSQITTISQLQKALISTNLSKVGTDFTLEALISIIEEATNTNFKDYYFILRANADTMMGIKSIKELFPDIKNQKPAEKLEINLENSIIFGKNGKKEEKNES